MSGTINLAFTQQFDSQGDPLSGGLLYFFTAGTTTPQSAFQDTSLTIVHPNPIVLDASGRVPMFYLADGFIKIRLTDKNGVTIIAADQLLVIGPSSGGGGGGGGAGDVTAALQTGDIKARYDTAVKDGFVRLNGNTIGNVGSSATERAEAVCQPLFEYLWPFSNITLQGFAKGASALADWGAGRQMILPDLRGRTIAGLDDMGATAASRLTSTYFGASSIVLGNVGGNEKHLLTAAELAPHTHTGSGTTATQTASVSVSGTTGGSGSLDHTHNYNDDSFAPSTGTAPGGNTPGGTSSLISRTTAGVNTAGNLDHTHSFSGGGTAAAHSHSFSVTTNNGDSVLGNNFSVANPAMVMTIYMKL